MYAFYDTYQYARTAHWFLLNSGVITQLSSAIVAIYLFYDGAVDIQIWDSLTGSQCKVSNS